MVTLPPALDRQLKRRRSSHVNRPSAAQSLTDDDQDTTILFASSNADVIRDGGRPSPNKPLRLNGDDRPLSADV
jgi:hypothetical protein